MKFINHNQQTKPNITDGEPSISKVVDSNSRSAGIMDKTADALWGKEKGMGDVEV